MGPPLTINHYPLIISPGRVFSGKSPYAEQGGVILADTSIWIDFFRKTEHSIDEQMTEHLIAGQVYGISVVFGALLQQVRDEREEKIILEFWKNLPKVEENNLFIDAGKLSYQHKLFSKGVGLIDCYILAASKRHQLEIWSLDKKLLQVFKLI